MYMQKQVFSTFKNSETFSLNLHTVKSVGEQGVNVDAVQLERRKQKGRWNKRFVGSSVSTPMSEEIFLQDCEDPWNV